MPQGGAKSLAKKKKNKFMQEEGEATEGCEKKSKRHVR